MSGPSGSKPVFTVASTQDTSDWLFAGKPATARIDPRPSIMSAVAKDTDWLFADTTTKAILTAPKEVAVTKESSTTGKASATSVAFNQAPETSPASAFSDHVNKKTTAKPTPVKKAIKATHKVTKKSVPNVNYYNKTNRFVVDQTDKMPLRKLLTVQKIDVIYSIPLLTVEVAIVNGHAVLVNENDDFQEGDLGLYLAMYTFVPKGDGRLDKVLDAYGCATMTVDGQQGHLVVPKITSAWEIANTVAEGIVFKLGAFHEIEEKIDEITKRYAEVDQSHENYLRAVRSKDFADSFGIKSWPDQDNRSLVLGKRPFFFPSTDSKKLAECPNFFTKHKYTKQVYQESIKLNGQSMTAYFVPKDSPFYKLLRPLPALYDRRAVLSNGRFGVCSKKIELNNLEKNMHWEAAIANELPKKLSYLNQSVAIMGELVGDGIEGNKYHYGPGERQFHIFSVFDIDNQCHWNPRDVQDLAVKLDLPHVPVRGYHTIRSIATNHFDLQLRADVCLGEGLVFKNTVDGRWFKVLSRPYIENHGDPWNENELWTPEKKAKIAKMMHNYHGGDVESVRRRIERFDSIDDQIDEICQIWAEAILNQHMLDHPPVLKVKREDGTSASSAN